MFDFIQQHKKLVIGIAISIIVILLFALLLTSRSSRGPTTNTNTNPNELDYAFLKDNVSEEDKYLMLLAKIAVEDYGTYSKNDTRSLQNLKNQSTAEFGSLVQEIMDSIPDGYDVVTLVDVDTVEIANSNSNSVAMQATTLDKVSQQETTTEYVVTFVREGGYWLVKDITKN